MYSVSDNYISLAQANARQIIVRAVFNGQTELNGHNIIDMTVTEAVNTSAGISMGATVSSRLNITVKMPQTPIALKGGTVKPYCGFAGASGGESGMSSDGVLIPSPSPDIDGNGVLLCEGISDIDADGIISFYFSDGAAEECPLGLFHVIEVLTKDDFGSVTLTAYDGFCKTEKKYTPFIRMPNTAEAVLGDMASQCGFSLSPDITYPNGEFDLYDLTVRQYIGYFAGLQGKNARFDRDGNLTFVRYQNHGYGIDRRLQFMGGFKRLTSEDVTVQSITSGTSGNIMTSGTGVGINFENPFMTQDILNGIFDSVGTFAFTPAQLKWRGDPAVEAGDIVMAEDKNGIYHQVYVMEQTLKIGGGMHSEIKCYGKDEAATAFDTSPVVKKLQLAYDKLQQAMKEATQLLNGANGGIFEVTDSDGDGVNDGWIIHSVDDKKFIKANVNGIGITTDGGATYRQAMTAEGIISNTIVVGSGTLGDVFSVDMDENGHPVVTIGSSANSIRQKQTNDAVTFVDSGDNTVAKFSATGAEWTDLQEMKYCGFVWTRSPVTGNVRFTKARES